MKKFVLVTVVLVTFLFGCKKNTLPVSDTEFVLNTVATIEILEYNGDEEPQSLVDECFSLVRKYESLFSRTIPESDISKLNNSNGEPVEVDTETIGLIEKALEYSILSEGAFDITIASVSELWDFTSEDSQLPKAENISLGLKSVDYNNIVIDGSSISLKNGTKIDAGGIAKGYISDRVCDFLREKGVTSAIINLGGNISLIGPDEDVFRIGIQKPFGKQTEFTGILKLKDTSAVTSGSYQRYFMKDGKIYHHILDTKTGYPVESDILSATIICESSMDADALSTTAFLLGSKEALRLINSLPYAEAVFILSDGSVVLSDNAFELYEEYK